MLLLPSVITFRKDSFRSREVEKTRPRHQRLCCRERKQWVLQQCDVGSFKPWQWHCFFGTLIWNREKWAQDMTLIVILATLSVASSVTSRMQIPIGTIFKKTGLEEMNDVFNAMSFAMDSHSSSNRSRDFMLKFFVDKIDTVDPYKLTKVICKQVRY